MDVGGLLVGGRLGEPRWQGRVHATAQSNSRETGLGRTLRRNLDKAVGVSASAYRRGSRNCSGRQVRHTPRRRSRRANCYGCMPQLRPRPRCCAEALGRRHVVHWCGNDALERLAHQRVLQRVIAVPCSAQVHAPLFVLRTKGMALDRANQLTVSRDTINGSRGSIRLRTWCGSAPSHGSLPGDLPQAGRTG
jgi:hypothetical protein